MRAFTTALFLIFLVSTHLLAQEPTQPAAAHDRDTVFIAQPLVGTEKWTVTVEGGSIHGQVRVDHNISLHTPPEAVADLKVTLFLRDDRAVQPTASDGQSHFDGVCRPHFTWDAGANYDLADVAFADLSEVQVEFRGQQSARMKFQTR